MATRTTTTEPVGPVGSFEQADKGLRKSMGLNAILFMSLGAIIGSGWLLGALKSAAVAGPASILSWAIGGIFIILIAMSYSELSGMLPRTGAIVRYPQLTHGAYTGWVIGWTYWISAISVPAIEAEAVITYLGGRFPSLGLQTTAHGVVVLTAAGIGVGVGLMLVFFFLNFFGVRLLGEVNRWFTWWKILIPTATFCMLFVLFRGSNFTSTAAGGFFARGSGNIFVAMSTSGVIFAYLGFRQALDYAGESKNPRRHVPLATIGSVLIAMIIYVGLQVGFIGALRWGPAGLHVGDWAGLTSSKWAATPLYSALRVAGIGALLTYSNFLLVDSAISPAATGWIYVGTGTRTNYGLGVHGYGPKALQWLNRFGIPWVSLIIAFVVGCVFFVPAPSWYTLVGFITSTTALTYIMGGLGIPIFRKYAGALHRPFRLGMAWFWAPVGFLAAALLVFWSTFPTLTDVYGAVFIGLPIYGCYYAIRKGWSNALWSYVIGAAFLGGWAYLSLRSGWVLRLSTTTGVQAPNTWSFGTYDIAMSAAVIFYCVAQWAVSNGEGRKHIVRTAWFIWMLLAIFPLDYYTKSVGPLTSPPLAFQWGTLIAVGIGIVAYYWGVASGFNTPELQDIVNSSGAGAAAVPPGTPSPTTVGQAPPTMPRTSPMGDVPPAGPSAPPGEGSPPTR